jgi:hypothetical protein
MVFKARSALGPLGDHALHANRRPARRPVKRTPWATTEQDKALLLPPGHQWAPALVIARAPGCHRVTAILTATSSTVPHSDTT